MRQRIGMERRWQPRPTRIRPQLLAVPNRAKVEGILCKQSRIGSLPIVAMELEREETLANGACIVLVVFVRNPERTKQAIVCRHVMRGDEPNSAAIEGGARVLGVAIAERLGLSIENDAADMLRMFDRAG